ncbi:MAG: hypothetical protein ACLVHS_07860 [Blautia wexlerae]
MSINPWMRSMQPSMTVRELQKGERAEWFLKEYLGIGRSPLKALKDKLREMVMYLSEKKTGDMKRDD